MKTFSDFGFAVPEILLPKNLDTASWSVIACDQYTQDRNYWQKAALCAKGKPSTLNLILPEVYLDDGNRTKRVANIKQTMRRYLDEGVFADAQRGFVYVERQTAFGRMRRGLVVAIDLESYEWKPFSKAFVRATEATIPARIPPRKEIRMNAPLESPHIMLLVNDAERLLVEKTGEVAKASGANPLYDGDLMMNGGSIRGWGISEKQHAAMLDALENIAEKNAADDGSVFMFAVGDGNHSLATAKAVWDEYKQTLSDSEKAASRVRYALVEIVNIYDEGLVFEPIHRVFFGADFDGMIFALREKLGGELVECESAAELSDAVKKSKTDFGFVAKRGGEFRYTLLKTNISALAVSLFQPVVDDYIDAQNRGADYRGGSDNDGDKSGAITIDYIHGADEVLRLASQENVTGALLPTIDKESFFATINKNGPLPRKSFSMGEADEKRFYLECRRLF